MQPSDSTYRLSPNTSRNHLPPYVFTAYKEGIPCAARYTLMTYFVVGSLHSLIPFPYSANGSPPLWATGQSPNQHFKNGSCRLSEVVNWSD